MLKRASLCAAYAMILCILASAILAPLLASRGYLFAATISYAATRAICHQHIERCISLGGHPMGLCSRCFSIYGAFFLCGLMLFFFREHFRCYSWKLAIFLCIPLVIDGATQLLGLRESTLLLRILTGCAFGFGLALIILPLAFEMCLDNYRISLSPRGKEGPSRFGAHPPLSDLPD